MNLMTFLKNKEQANIVLALGLWKKGKIITSKVLFKVLIKQEVDKLTKQKIFNFI